MPTPRKPRKPDTSATPKARRGRKGLKDMQVQGKGPQGGKGTKLGIGSQSTGAGAGKVTF